MFINYQNRQNKWVAAKLVLRVLTDNQKQRLVDPVFLSCFLLIFVNEEEYEGARFVNIDDVKKKTKMKLSAITADDYKNILKMTSPIGQIYQVVWRTLKGMRLFCEKIEICLC